jgi:invasion protein IalB
MRRAIMLNKALAKQTLVAILLATPTLADPPAARVPVRGFDDWRLDCRGTPCAIYTAVSGTDGGEVLRIAVEAGPAPALVVTTPLPLYLPDGLALLIAGGPALALPWRTCGAYGCEARLPLAPEFAAALRRERAGSATFTLVEGVPVRLGFSLVGYVAAARARDASP